MLVSLKFKLLAILSIKKKESSNSVAAKQYGFSFILFKEKTPHLCQIFKQTAKERLNCCKKIESRCKQKKFSNDGLIFSTKL